MTYTFIDLLNREEDLKKIINVIETLSTNKENSNSYAIEGNWGCGKSWLINRLAAELYDMLIISQKMNHQYSSEHHQYQ